MNNDQLEKAIEYLLQQQATFFESLTRLESQTEEDRKLLRELVKQNQENAKQAEFDRKVITEAFSEIKSDVGRLVDIVENTRDFTQQVAKLAISSEKRLKLLEERVDKVE